MVERRKLDALLGLCETTKCRRQVMLGYFGEDLPEPCGNCDTCLEPVDDYDGTLVARKALSCVHLTGQRFGVGHLTDVLTGKDTDRIRQFGHDQLKAFNGGKGTERARNGSSVFRQLVAMGMLTRGHGGLRRAEADPRSRPRSCATSAKSASAKTPSP